MPTERQPRIVVRTPDRREYRGRQLEIQTRENGKKMAVVRLDTGWVTSYPVEMVHEDTSAEGA